MRGYNKLFLLGLIVVFIVVLAGLGLGGWLRFIVPNLGKVSGFSLPALLGFSFLAGAVSFFAPCSFVLFPGYIAFYLGLGEEKKVHPIKLGLVASLGVMSFFVMLSAVIIALGSGVVRYFSYIAPAVGFLLVVFGLILFLGYSFRTDAMQTVFSRLKSKERRSGWNMYLFGFGYGVVSLGCTLPLLFAMIIVPLTDGKIFNVFLSVVTYAAAMSALMIFVTYLVWWSEDRVIKRMVQSTAMIKKLSGVALIIIGAYLVYYNVFYSMI